MILVDNGDANGDTPPNILRTSNPIWYNANNCTPLEALVSYWIDSFWCLQLWNHQEIRLKEDVADLRRLIQEIWRNTSDRYWSVDQRFQPSSWGLGDFDTSSAINETEWGAPTTFWQSLPGPSSPAVGRSWNHLKMVVDLRYQDTPRLHGLIWTYIGIYRIIAQDSTLNWMVYEIINDYHFLLSECSFAGASKNTQMVQRGSLAPRRMSGTFANICAMSSLGMPSIYIYI